jgi:DNA-binding NarL/FixJ family response regulator
MKVGRWGHLVNHCTTVHLLYSSRLNEVGVDMLDDPVEVKLSESQDRWSAALSTFSTLRRDSQALIEQIRRSMNEMRALRARLVQAPSGPTSNGSTPPELPRPVHFQLQYGLTPREMQVAMLLAEGRSNEDLASALKISPHTARHHTQHVLAKLGVHSRSQAGAKIRNW